MVLSAMGLAGPALFVGGQFTEANDLPMQHVARWDGSNWSELETGILDDESDPCWCGLSDCDCGPNPGVVHALASSGGALYVGGRFVRAACIHADNLVAWACPPPDAVPADLDRDGDVDAADFEVFESCATGPALGPPATCCQAADLDHDGDVDTDDFGRFQRCLTAPGFAADPDCAQ